MKRKPTPLERCAEELPKMVDPCRVCKYIGSDGMSHAKSIEICQSCCWYYPSMFQEKRR